MLGELLDLILPPDAIDTTATGNNQFNRRYGFLDKPERIRLRSSTQAARRWPNSTKPI